MNESPLVSICIPTYNGEIYIKECLNSAINQTYSNIEIIISDDNSSDSTTAISKNLLIKKNIDFKIIKNSPWKKKGNLWNLYNSAFTPWKWHKKIFRLAKIKIHIK